jgi:diguanylate cyclase (GGDEF)-like protein
MRNPTHSAFVKAALHWRPPGWRTAGEARPNVGAGTSGRSPANRRLILICVTLIAAIAGATGWLIVSQRAADLARGLHATTDLAQALAEETSRIVQPVDLTLREVLGRLTLADDLDSSSNLGSKATFDLLTERLKGLPQVDALIVIGADGRLVNFSRAYPPARLDASNRDYFQYLSTHDDYGLFISAPAKAYLDGKWTVYLARRVNGPHGEFAGTVVAAVTLSFLEDFYRAAVPDHVAVTVLRRDGVILMRYPHIDARIGEKLPRQAPWYRLLVKNGGSYLSPGFLQPGASLVSVRPLREFPLVIDVSTPEAAALSGWLPQSLWLVAGAMFATCCVILLVRTFGRQYAQLAAQNAELETGRMRFDAVLDNMSQGLTLFDAGQRLMVCNRRFAEMYGLSREQVRPGTPFQDIIKHRIARGTFLAMKPDDYVARAQNLVDTTESFELVNELSDGRAMLLHSRPLGGGGWVSTHEDITERRRAEAALAFMARHDALTELPNRTLFQERLNEAIARARRGSCCALLCLDLDHFKMINDTLGHPVGDSLLRAVADRLSAAVRNIDTVARLGGDEFAIIQADLDTPNDSAVLANRIIATLNEPFDIDGHRVVTGTSIGIAMAPNDGTSSDTLLRNADIALYLAKAEGRGVFRFFEPQLEARVQARREVEVDLRNALPANEFSVYYQPILNLRSGKVAGFEALIRWNHPTRGLIGPADFIPIAEETGLIVPIGDWVLRAACLEAANWPRDIEIAVNLSSVQFKSGQLLDSVRQALAISGLDPNRLELEITESILLQNSQDTRALLHQLRALGIRIALDDFGTGYSSLGYLRSFPFDKIKIDRSFVRDIGLNSGSAVIVGAVVSIARGLGMTTVAEGVETADQLARVRSLGCSMVQGYLFSRPRPSAEVPGLIRSLHVFDRDYVAEAVS